MDENCFDVAVVGAGHAGIEAGLACARLGVTTALFSLSMDAVANMPCNPSIGGTGKGHLVKEIDALGGEMGNAADHTFLQSRILNRGKGPAVYSLRMQIDRAAYRQYMKRRLEEQKNLYLKQEEISELFLKNGEIVGLGSKTGERYAVKAVILCCGTYLDGKIFVGKTSYASGPDHSLPALPLAKYLQEMGIKCRKFKTGTPPRVHARSIHYDCLEKQFGDEAITPFSFRTPYHSLKNSICCYIAYTNEKTHQIIRENLEQSPMYSGKIEGTGPRYCPSIEDKVVRFADKKRHQIFVEPMGLDTKEVYLQGLSTSMPTSIQEEFLRTIRGFEDIEIIRSGYAIEYISVDPLELYPTLAFKKVKGLYGAGQINGTSGYEEAAAQGLVAGINAARKVLHKKPVILERSQSYIGTMIDDLVTKGCTEPYRMMTARSEYRLWLRQDNAEQRLLPLGHEIGLIQEKEYKAFLESQKQLQTERERLRKKTLAPTEELNAYFVSRGTSPITQPITLENALKRPQVEYQGLLAFDDEAPELSRAQAERLQVLIKYEGYIKKQERKIREMEKWSKYHIPSDINYHSIATLRLEAREKLSRARPMTIGQAMRTLGVTPADITALFIYLEKGKK